MVAIAGKLWYPVGRTTGGVVTGVEKRDFFISYTQADTAEAEWIAKTLTEHGYSVYIQAWNILPEDDFLTRMSVFLEFSNSFIAVWSKGYSESKFCMTEFRAGFAMYSRGLIEHILPIRVEHWSMPRLYSAMVHVDIFGISGAEKERRLLNAIGYAKDSRSKTNLANIFSNFIRPDSNRDFQTSDDKDFDVFISFASEDRDDFVDEFVKVLKDVYHIRVWYDEYEIQWGDNLREKIDEGMKKAKLGLVVLSRPYFEKQWTLYEYNALFQKRKKILPLWHNITREEVEKHSPELSNTKALKTSEHDIYSIAEKLVKIVRN